MEKTGEEVGRMGKTGEDGEDWGGGGGGEDGENWLTYLDPLSLSHMLMKTCDPASLCVCKLVLTHMCMNIIFMSTSAHVNH